MNFLVALLQIFGKKPIPPPTMPPQPSSPPIPPTPVSLPGDPPLIKSSKPPRLDPITYGTALYKEASKSGKMPDDFTPEAFYPKPYGYTPVEDDLNTVENERRTYCNFFVRTVARWFGWTNFKPPNWGGAGAMTRFMAAHPEIWEKLEGPWTYGGQSGTGPDYERATELATQGYLVIAAQVNQDAGKPGQATGHVCIVAPEKPTLFSSKWKRPVSICANIGASNFYGKTLSWAFGKEPMLFRFLGT